MGAEEFMRSLMVCRLSGRKTSASWRLVMMRVFEGGVGWLSGGRLERSIDILTREDREVGRDDSGVDNEDIVKF